ADRGADRVSGRPALRRRDLRHHRGRPRHPRAVADRRREEGRGEGREEGVREKGRTAGSELPTVLGPPRGPAERVERGLRGPSVWRYLFRASRLARQLSPDTRK